MVFQFINQPILPEIMQTLAIGLIAVTIAIAIFLAEKGTIFAFDRIVILKKVIRGKTFLLYFFMLFAPLFFWDLSGLTFRIILFIFFTIGTYGVSSLLFRSYKWIEEIETEDKRSYKGYRQDKRLEYFEEISDEPQKLIAWEYIWQLGNKHAIEERAYVEKFIQNINLFWKRNNEKAITEYLISFEKYVDNITVRDWVVFENLFSSLLRWHFEVNSSTHENKNNKRRFMQLTLVIERLIEDFVKKGLTPGVSYTFFESLQVFLSDDMRDSDREKYVRQLWSIIAPTFFKNITDSSESREIWYNYFPKEWKVTKQTIADKQNLIARLWLQHYIIWAQQKILKHYGNELKWDKELESVSSDLFPNVDPITWAIILTFIMRPWTEGEKAKNIIEDPRKFGLIGRVQVTWADDENTYFRKMKEERDNAIELALILFSKEFTRENLQDYVTEINKLNYNKESRDAKSKVIIKNVFEDMLKHLNKEIKN